MDALKLARMANQIGDFFESELDRAVALEGIASHLRRFWEPRMREQLVSELDHAAGATLTPLVREAVMLNRERLTTRTEKNPAPRG